MFVGNPADGIKNLHSLIVLILSFLNAPCNT